MKPVEIEFLMKDSLTAGLDKSKMSVEQLLGAARRASMTINSKIKEQRSIIDGINTDLGNMERKLQAMKPGTGQHELLVEISACKKALADEIGVLSQLEQEHREAQQGVSRLEQEYKKIAVTEEQAAVQSRSLTTRIAEQKEAVRQVEANVRTLQKAYEKAMPGPSQKEALKELNAAKKALEEDKAILSALTDEQEKNKESNRKLAMQLRELQDTMTRMRLEGRQDSDEYRRLAGNAAVLADTLADVKRQTGILSDDDANLQGFVSGVNGLSGAFTTATGVVSLFASENENLAKVQARVQSVMAITMGLQQAFNALNKDSAFRLVTVAKAKNLLTTANHRLAAALGISNTAASALMATLTLGLSVVVTGLVAAWNRFSDAQDEARRKALELVEVESQGRAGMLKTRFEIDTTRESLKNFNGTKEEEKRKCEELNRRYGEAFGYYDTAAQWYDVLTRKSEKYIQMLFLQAKAQSMVSKATEADEEYNKIKATKPDDAESSMGWLRKGMLYFAQAAAPGMQFDARGAIEDYNMKAWQKEMEAAETKRDDFLRQAADLERKIAEIAGNEGLGGHAAPQKATSGGDAGKEERRYAEMLALRQKNIQAEIGLMKDGAEKKRQQLKADYEKEMAELSTLEQKWLDAQHGSLDRKQADALETARRLARSKYDAGEEEVAREEAGRARAQRQAEIQAMVEYLKEYGSYQQQKLAIAEEYAHRIAEVEASEAGAATKEWQRKRLEKERLRKEASLSFENISRGIDWHALFSGVGDLTKEMMAPMMEQLQAWVRTDEYRDADAETQQKVTELIQEMRRYVGTDQGMTWQALDKAIKDFTASVAAYDKARKAEDAAVRSREEGRKKLAAGRISEPEYKELERKARELGDATAKAREDMESFASSLNRTSEEVANFTSGLTSALDNARGWTGAAGFGEVQNAAGGIDRLKGTLDSLLPKLGDGMAKNIGTTLSSTIGSGLSSIGSGLSGVLSSGLGSIIGIAAQVPRLILELAGAVKGFVTGILDSLTELVSLRWIDDLVVSILDAVGRLTDAIFDLPENLFHVLEGIVVDGVGGLVDGVLGRIGNVLTFGALGSDGPGAWFTNGNAKEVAAAIERLTDRNKLLEQAIEDLTDEMKTARGSSAIDASQRARRLQEETNANYRRIAQEQAGYHDSHHSWNYYWEGFSQEQVERLSRQIGRQWNGDLWGLSPEEMKMLRSNVDMWEQIQNTGKGGYGNSVADKLNDYIEQAGKLQEITDALYETLTTTTKASVFDDFLNDLYALADGSEDVMENIAGNWQRMVNRMAVNNLVGARFQKSLEGWYENLARLNEARTNGEMTDEEYRKRLDALKAEYEGYVESARRDIETLRSEGIVKATEEAGGVTQGGKAGAFTTMSQEQAGKLEGLFVSGQMHWASMDDKLTDVSRQMDEAGDHLRQIAANTGSSASSLAEIKADIRKIIRDGLRVN